MRIGQGFDVHRFSADPARPLVLAGVVVAPGGGLAGHSDADVVCHAIADALLGASGLGDLGAHFPDDDEQWAGVDSTRILGEVVALAAGAGWVVGNVDCTILAEAPRLAPHVPAMRQRLEALVAGPVSVKATTLEGLGSLGRGEGIACMAVVLMAST